MKERPTEEQIREAINRLGSLDAAATSFGVTRQSLWRWIRLYGIRIERVSRAA